MKNLKFQSVFDIISPVMVGPSSSHTAGAVRIGKIVSAIFGDAPTEVEFQLFNSFAKTYRGHGTDVALVAGILGMETDDPDIAHALDIAHEKGIKVYWKIKNKDSNLPPHPNTTRITLKNTSLLLINLISIFNVIIMIRKFTYFLLIPTSLFLWQCADGVCSISCIEFGQDGLSCNFGSFHLRERDFLRFLGWLNLEPPWPILLVRVG